jgi:hypothetical protein
MRLLLALALMAGTSAQAQLPATPPFVPQPAWNPAADYVTAGQDEPGYRAWMARQPWHAAAVASYHRYLADAGVAYVAPTWQLLRTASDWQRCGAEPFEVPPTYEWDNVVQTLRFVRDYVIPALGPVEPVSVYRNPSLNACAGGAKESVHKQLSAIDMVPLRPTSRPDMMNRLCAAHATAGPRYAVGLGFYTKLRFHVDSWKFRTWGRNDAGELACDRSVETYDDPVVAQGPPVAPADPLAPR